MTTIYFRVIVQAKPLYLEGEEKIDFGVDKSGENIHIVLERIPKDELREDERDGEIRCVAMVKRTLTPEQLTLVEQFKDTEQDDFDALISSTETQLRLMAERVIYTYRWYRSVPNSHNPVRRRMSMFYSFDGLIWQPVRGPQKVKLVVKFGHPMRQIGWGFVEQLQKLAQEDVSEPIGHSLYAEALELKSSNPKSALLIGIAALETGFKEFVARLAPDAAWLVENAPTPPLMSMFKHYLPQLPCKLSIGGKVLPPPNKIMGILDSGVQLRNKVAHGREKEVNADKLDELLNAIRDLLYLFDYYGGQAWAWYSLSHEITKTLLINSKTK
jgi:hypothetical protein